MTNDPTETTRDRRVTTFLALGAGIPLVVTAAAVIAQIAVRSSLPDRIAVHWNAAGEPDRWGAPWTIVVLTLVVGAAVPLAVTLPSVRPLREGLRGQSFRAIAAVSASTSTAIAVLLSGTVIQQRDGGTAAPATLIGIGLVAAVAVAAAVWFASPADEARDPVDATDPLSLRPGERVVWLGTESVNRLFVGVALITFASAAIAVVATWTSGAPAGAIIGALVIVLVVGVAAATALAFHIRIDATGLTVRSVAGFPRFHVPAADIESVAVVPVRAIGEFGGFGIRLATGRTGIILRSGPAIEVSRRDGRRAFVVTVRDAESAAAALATVAEAARA